MAYKKENKIDQDHGQLRAGWEFPEHAVYRRTFQWYLIVGVILLGIIIYAIVVENFLFAIFLIVFALIIFLHTRNKPLMLKLKIFEDGLQVGNRFYEWNEIKNFRIVYRPPEVKRLYLDLKNCFLPDFSVPLEKENPIEIRRVLKEYLAEDLSKEEETLLDSFSRWLKI